MTTRFQDGGRDGGLLRAEEFIFRAGSFTVVVAYGKGRGVDSLVETERG
jgi:hypothetical protein